MALQVVTANRLGDGRVVYLANDDLWVEEVGRARIAETEDAGKALVAVAEKAVADRTVVAPYLIDVTAEGDRVTPTRYRELLRALGPSSHPEFGRPAAATAAQR
jgi:sulfite reductase (NADPH) hemoprotein beta-component